MKKKRAITAFTDKKPQMELGKEQDDDFYNMKKLSTEEACLAHYSKDQENVVTTDAKNLASG